MICGLSEYPPLVARVDDVCITHNKEYTIIPIVYRVIKVMQDFYHHPKPYTLNPN